MRPGRLLAFSFIAVSLGYSFSLLRPATSVDAAKVAWEMRAPAPLPRTEVSAAVLDGKIYLIGGFTKEGVTARVERYDPETDRWSSRSSMPVPLHHAGAVALNGKIYVVGGLEGGRSWKPSDGLWEYDPRTDRWTAKREMPTARGALGVGVSDGKLYAVGGLGATRPFELLGNTGANEVYDPATDQWEKKAPLPTPRDHLAVAVVDGKIHAMGGRFNSNYSENLALHHVYDPAVNRWNEAAPLSRPRSGIAAAVLNGKIHLFGGEAPQGTFADHDVYEPSSDQWQSAPPMPTPRHGLGAATVGERIFVIVGGPRPGGSFSSANEVFRTE